MNLPNKLTLIRFALCFVVLILMVLPYSAMGWDCLPLGNTGFNLIDLLCCFFFIVASLTDMLDGKIARKYNLITDFGKFMDPLADKALVNTSLVLLGIYKPYLMPAAVVVLFIVRDLAVDGLRFVASAKGQVIAANKYGKLKTVFQMVAIPFIFLNGFPFTYVSPLGAQIFCYILISLALVMSLISGCIYIYNGRNIIFPKKGEEEQK